MPKPGQDTNQVDPNDPYAKVRQNVVNQAGSDPTVAPPPSTPSTPSPTFTTQPTPGTTPQPQPPSPTFGTQPVPGGTLPAGTPNPSVTTQPAPGTTPVRLTTQQEETPVRGPGTTTAPGDPAGTATGGGATGGATGGAGSGSAASTPQVFGTDQFQFKLGGGWNDPKVFGADPNAQALMTAINMGYIGQHAVDYANAHGGAGLAYYADRDQYATPSSYVAKNGAGAYDLIARQGGGESSEKSSQPLGLTTTATTTPFADQVRKMLMDRIGQLGQPLDVNDPTIQQPFDAANLAAQRQLEQGKKDTAERLYASGDLNTNAVQMAGTQANERAATGLAGVKANLIANQLQQRATQLQQLYSLAVASGDSESARQVQLELAGIQAELAREGFGVSLANITANQNTNAVTGLI